MNRILTNVFRALRLRCPHCGQGRLFASWFSMRDRCPACGLKLEREEGYFTGAMAINLIVAEGLFVVGLVASFVAVWPETPGPWLYGLVLVMIGAPLLCYPFSKALWLGFDLVFRPATPQEFVEIAGPRKG